MSKFNRATARPSGTSPITSTGTAATYESGAGFTRDVKSELFLLAVTNMVGEDTFYEAAGDRDTRFAELVHAVAVRDAHWLGRFIPWLRSEANLRSASLVAAAEAVKARLDAGLAGGNRSLIDAACRRADEPGELLAYWTGRYGRAIPKPVKRGLADAVARLYNERSLLKYDTDSKGYRFADVIDLVHPSPAPDSPWQGEFFAHALDRRHQRDKPIPERLTMLHARAELAALPIDQRRDVVLHADGQARLRAAGMTWEALAGWLQGPLDKAAWEAVIPSMGYMACLRNLRNFDEAGVGDEVADRVAAKLADPDEVAASRQLPFRFLSAYRAAPSLRWAWALERAVGLSLRRVPKLDGRTLILVDTSGSMHAPFSRDGTLMRWDAAALFGVALAARAERADVVSFSNQAKPFALKRRESVLSALTRWNIGGWFLNGGTQTVACLRASYRDHDRVVIITDEQAAYDPRDLKSSVPAYVPVYTWNLAGYRVGHAPSGAANRHTFGGLGDQAFAMVPLLEAGRNAAWPF
jgi:TROVE domain